MHHVAAAEGLRVLEGGAVHALPGLQIDEVEHHRRGAEIDREPEHVSPVAVHHLAVVEHLVAPPRDEGIERRGRAGRIRMGAHQDARAAAERRKRHVDVVALDHRLAGEAVGSAQEALGLGAGAESAASPALTSTTHSWQRPLRWQEVGTSTASSSAQSKSVMPTASGWVLPSWETVPGPVGSGAPSRRAAAARLIAPSFVFARSRVAGSVSHARL